MPPEVELANWPAAVVTDVAALPAFIVSMPLVVRVPLPVIVLVPLTPRVIPPLAVIPPVNDMLPPLELRLKVPAPIEVVLVVEMLPVAFTVKEVRLLLSVPIVSVVAP